MSFEAIMEEARREHAHNCWMFAAMRQQWADLLWRQWIETGAV